MKYILIFICAICSLWVLPAFSDNMILHGKAVLITENGEEIPATNIKLIKVANHDIDAKTDYLDENGNFSIELKDKNLSYGDKIKLEIDCDGWVIYSPVDGEMYIPKKLETETINVKLVANKSEVNIDNYSAKFSPKEIYIVQGSKNYFVQVFASNSLDKAAQVQDSLINNGFMNAYYKQSYYTDNEKGLHTYYKVIVGSYDTKNEAMKAKNRINNYQIFSDSFVVPWIN